MRGEQLLREQRVQLCAKPQRGYPWSMREKLVVRGVHLVVRDVHLVVRDVHLVVFTT